MSEKRDPAEQMAELKERQRQAASLIREGLHPVMATLGDAATEDFPKWSELAPTLSRPLVVQMLRAEGELAMLRARLQEIHDACLKVEMDSQSN